MLAFASSSLIPASRVPAPSTPACTTRGAALRMTASESGSMGRRAFLLTTLSAAAAAAVTLNSAPAYAEKLTGDYSQDAASVLASMKTATELTRGTPGIADTVQKTRQEMNDFVALYRRNNKVSGTTSFSTLYTAINTLSGHYASYGNSYPVPEKRKKRLNQQFTDVARALSRGR